MFRSTGVSGSDQYNQFTMKDIVWIIIVILIAGWLLGYLSFSALLGNLIHILLVAAIILIILKLLKQI